MEIVSTGKIHVGSFLIGILVALMLISVFLSYQSRTESQKANAAASESLKTSKENGEKIDAVVRFIKENDFVKQ